MWGKSLAPLRTDPGDAPKEPASFFMSSNSAIIRRGIETDVPAIARINVDTWRFAYRGIVPQTYLADLSYEKQAERVLRYMATPGTFYFVVESPGFGVIGYMNGGRERTGDAHFPGEIYAIYILPQFHRTGIGLLLVQAWARALREAGMNAGLVWALADNIPAVQFYQRLGGRPVREQMIEIGGALLKETAFGWSDFDAIFQASRC